MNANMELHFYFGCTDAARNLPLNVLFILEGTSIVTGWTVTKIHGVKKTRATNCTIKKAKV